jgi:hypothetical protein
MSIGGWWSYYKGRSCGRIIHAIDMYCGLRIAEEIQIGNGTITLYGKPFATYTWEDEDIPNIIFTLDQDKSFIKNQFLLKPFIDNYNFANEIPFIVQELRHKLTLDQGLHIKWIWESKGNNKYWNSVDIKIKIILKALIPHMYLEDNSFGKINIEDIWEHLAYCAIYEIL